MNNKSEITEVKPWKGKTIITPGFNPGKAEPKFPALCLKYRRWNTEWWMMINDILCVLCAYVVFDSQIINPAPERQSEKKHGKIKIRKTGYNQNNRRNSQ